ncbi:hypothetical protein C5167_030581 [Papaver somniferum]|nr:hypothetical protein C5167_030581 [Papaver somniferum]
MGEVKANQVENSVCSEVNEDEKHRGEAGRIVDAHMNAGIEGSISAGLCEEIVNKIMNQQEELHKKLLQDMERKEEERVTREEIWKKKEMDRVSKEIEMRAKEQAIACDRETTIIEFLKKFTSKYDETNFGFIINLSFPQHNIDFNDEDVALFAGDETSEGSSGGGDCRGLNEETEVLSVADLQDVEREKGDDGVNGGNDDVGGGSGQILCFLIYFSQILLEIALTLFLSSDFDLEFILVPSCLGHVWWFELVFENRLKDQEIQEIMEFSRLLDDQGELVADDDIREWRSNPKGKPAAEAKATAEREHPEVTAVIIPKNEARIDNFCANRVWLNMNNDRQRTVVVVPMIG